MQPQVSDLKAYLVDLWFQRDTEGGLNRGHDVLGQGPNFFPRCTAVVHEDQGLLVVHAVCLTTVPFPPCSFDEPAGSKFDLS